MAEDRTQFPFRVSQELYEKFNAAANRMNVSKNMYLKLALLEYMKKEHESLTPEDIQQIEEALTRVLENHPRGGEG